MKKCKCGANIMRHWKYCEDCTKTKDVIGQAVYGVSLREQNLRKENSRLLSHNERLIKDLTELERQYAILQDNFHTLAAHKVTLALEKLSTPRRKS